MIWSWLVFGPLLTLLVSIGLDTSPQPGSKIATLAVMVVRRRPAAGPAMAGAVPEVHVQLREAMQEGAAAAARIAANVLQPPAAEAALQAEVQAPQVSAEAAPPVLPVPVGIAPQGPAAAEATCCRLRCRDLRQRNGGRGTGTIFFAPR